MGEKRKKKKGLTGEAPVEGFLTKDVKRIVPKISYYCQSMK